MSASFWRDKWIVTRTGRSTGGSAGGRKRCRAPRFDNRRRLEGWLAPSIQKKLDAHVRLVNFAKSILPVTDVIAEVANLGIQAIKTPGIEGTEYQQGEQAGFWNLREYILHRDGHQRQLGLRVSTHDNGGAVWGWHTVIGPRCPWDLGFHRNANWGKTYSHRSHVDNWPLYGRCQRYCWHLPLLVSMLSSEQVYLLIQFYSMRANIP